MEVTEILSRDPIFIICFNGEAICEWIVCLTIFLISVKMGCQWSREDFAFAASSKFKQHPLRSLEFKLDSR